MDIQVVEQEGNGIPRRQGHEGSLDESDKIFFGTGRVKPELDEPASGYFIGGDQTSGAVADILGVLPAGLPLFHGPAGNAFQSLDAGFLVHAYQVRLAWLLAACRAFDGLQDQLANQGYAGNESAPIFNLGEEPVTRFMRLELVPFLKSPLRTVGRSDLPSLVPRLL